MNCAICNENAEFHCLCQNISLCKYHSWYHKDKLGHRIEQININFSSFLSPDLRKEILKRLKKIKESKLQISSLIKSITLKIENSSKETLKELDSHYEFYLNLLSFEKLPKSMPNEIENMISFSLRLKKISKQLKETFEEVFNQSLVSFVLKDDQFSQNDKTPDKKIREDLISIESYFKKKELQINTEEPILRDPKKNRNTYKNLRERNPFRSIFFMSFVFLLCVILFSYFSNYSLLSLFGFGPVIKQPENIQMKIEPDVNYDINEVDEFDNKNYDAFTEQPINENQHIIKPLYAEYKVEKEIEMSKDLNRLSLHEKKQFIKSLEIDYFDKWFTSGLFKMKLKEIKFSENKKLAFLCNF